MSKNSDQIAESANNPLSSEEGTRVEDAESGDVAPTGAVPEESVGLDQVTGAFQRRLHFPDPTVIYVVLGALAANYLPGDPVWLLLVGPPGRGKTEILNSLRNVPNLHEVATLTEGSLLSGTSEREHAEEAVGGLLLEIGEGQFGIILAKDFGSVLSMPRDARGQLLAALREIYDGSWTRRVGTDGGRRLHWHGKVGLIAGCTQAVDKHHSVIAAMGERFLIVRLPDRAEEELEIALARAAIAGSGDEQEMRAGLADVVGHFLESVRGREPRELSEHEGNYLITLARLVVRARSAVDRDGRSREIEFVYGTEAPTRLVKQLERLLAGLDVIGLPREEALRIIGALALDNIPPNRRTVLGYLHAEDSSSTQNVADALDLPTTTVKRALEDLTAHGLVGRSGESNALHWRLSPVGASLYRAALGRSSDISGEPQPEMSDGVHESQPEKSDGENNFCPECRSHFCEHVYRGAAA